MRMVGLKDTFGESGKPDQLMEKYEITWENIRQACLSLLSLLK